MTAGLGIDLKALLAGFLGGKAAAPGPIAPPPPPPAPQPDPDKKPEL